MKLDLIEVKPKLNKKKIIFMAIGTILIIAFFSFLGIKVAEDYNKKLIASRKQKQLVLQEKKKELISEEKKQKREESIESINQSEQTIENMNINQLPVYSENAKKKLKSLYTINEKVAYLTFDDGPSQTVTPQILDLLKQENIKATFFVLGMRVKANPDLVKREYEEGHYIANHGYSHDYASIYIKV